MTAVKVIVAFNRRDEADWWCGYNKIPDVWGKAFSDNSIYGMSLLYTFPEDYEAVATMFALKFA